MREDWLFLRPKTLSDYTDERLIRELEKRGYTVERENANERN